MVEEGVVEKEGGDKKAVGFLWKVFFFFSLSLYFVCVHPCFAKHSAALTHFRFSARLQGFCMFKHQRYSDINHHFLTFQHHMSAS